MASTSTGRECTLAINTSNDYDAPTWVAVTIAKDVSVSRSVDKLEDNCRAAGAYKQYLPGLIDLSVDLEVCHRNTDSNWNLVENAILNGTTLDVAIVDGPIVDAEMTSGTNAVGMRMVCNVYECENSQPLEDPLSDSYTFAPTADLNAGSNTNQVGPARITINGTA